MPAVPTLPPETTERLRAFAALLAAWTRRINLVSSSDRDVIWTRHVQDSLRLLPLIPPGTVRAIDLGSGAGLPGLVLAVFLCLVVWYRYRREDLSHVKRASFAQIRFALLIALPALLLPVLIRTAAGPVITVQFGPSGGPYTV